MTDINRILKNNAYFEILNDTERHKLGKIIKLKSYQKSEIIFMEGEKGKGLFLIISGKIKLVKMSEDGGEQILHIFKRGNVFAEVVLFDKGPYPATAIALEKSIVGLIRHKEMNELIKNNPSIAIKLLNVMSKRLRSAQEKIRNFGLKNSASRVAGIINYLMEEYGQKYENEIKIELSLTQEELSNMAGVSRETISRILNEFAKDGLLSVKRKQIIVKKPVRLKEMT